MKSIPHPIDVHVGRRLRARRRLLGLTQEALASAVDIKFQQIQKYESGSNRVSASRLWALSRALEVPVSYFFEGMNGSEPAFDHDLSGEYAYEKLPVAEILDEKETIDLVRCYYQLDKEPRRRLLDLARAMTDMD